MKNIALILISLFVGSFSYAQVNPCPMKIKNVEYSDGGSEWKDSALDALNTCASQGDSETIKLAALMQDSCEKMTHKIDRKMGLCYISAAKVIALSLNF